MPQGDLQRVVLLLTATVDVGETPYVAVVDPAKRLDEYARALEWYLNVRQLSGIVFCENSGYPIPAIRSLSGRAVEVLQFEGNAYSATRGKGHGEMSIVRHAMEQSHLVDDAAIVMKITGRYVVRNAGHLAGTLERGAPADVVVDLRQGLSRADTRICAFTRDFARTFLLPQQERVDDSRGYHFEHAFARAVHLAIADGGRWRPWRLEPDILGNSGTGGAPYRRDLVRRTYRSLLRRAQWVALER